MGKGSKKKTNKNLNNLKDIADNVSAKLLMANFWCLITSFFRIKNHDKKVNTIQNKESKTKDTCA